MLLRLSPPLNPSPIRLALAALIIFLLSIGVRLLQKQDAGFDLARNWGGFGYDVLAEKIADGQGVLFPKDPEDPSNIRMLVRPPGYPLITAAFIKLFKNPEDALTLFQIFLDSIAAVLVLLITARLFPIAAAVIAGALVAFSPHLSYYSLWLTADSICTPFILTAVYCLILAIDKPRIGYMIFAGALLGICCWIRPNALLLSPFLALAAMPFLVRGKRFSFAAAMVAASIAAVMPITIRNLIVFDKFALVSIGAGESLIVGIADYDDEGRFGMPKSDAETIAKEALWYNRPDYKGLWGPDGIKREEGRISRSLAVIKENPLWFLKTMLRRTAFMLSYNDSGARNFPFNTAIVPIVSSEPTSMHSANEAEKLDPIWSANPTQLLKAGNVLTEQAEASIADDALKIVGDESSYGDQFVLPIVIEKHSDYALSLSIISQQGEAAAKITGADRKTVIAVAILPQTKELNINANAIEVVIPFASGDRTQGQMVLCNNGTERPQIQIGSAKLVKLGATPYLWTRYPRAIVRALQKNLYQTKIMILIIAAGILLAVAAKRFTALALLLAIPIYYICTHSPLHVEYRYTLPMHYALFSMGSVTIYSLSKALRDGVGRIKKGLLFE